MKQNEKSDQRDPATIRFGAPVETIHVYVGKLDVATIETEGADWRISAANPDYVDREMLEKRWSLKRTAKTELRAYLVKKLDELRSQLLRDMMYGSS